MTYEKKTILSAITNGWLSLFAAQGLNKDILITAAGLDRHLLEDPDARIPHDKHTRMLEIGMKQVHDPALGLHIAEFIPIEHLGILGQLVISSRNIREAISQMVRFARLAVEKIKWELIEKTDSAIFIHSEEGEDPIQARERILAGLITTIRKFSDENVQAIEVCFQHPAPSYMGEYERVFGCKPLFSQPINAIEFDRHYLDVELPNFSPYIARLVDRHAESLIQKTKTEDKIKDQVKKIISESLHTGLIDIEAVCKKLSISRWTLARKLRKEKTSFREVLDSTQKQLSLGYLQSTTHTINEIALLSGFSSRSAFNRAFIRWTGKKPSEYFKRRSD